MSYQQYPPPPPGGYTQPMQQYQQYPTYPVHPEPTMRTIRRVNIVSAMKVGAVLNALVWAIFGLIFGLCNLLFVGAMLNGLNSFSRSSSGNTGAVLGGSFVVLLIVWVVGILVAAIAGAIGGAIYAWLYNVTARMTGGLEVEIG